MCRLSRRSLLAGAGAFILPQIQPLRAAPLAWTPAAPGDAGFVPDLEARLDQLVAAKRVWNLHGVLVVRRRRVVLERYFAGEDQSWGRALGRIDFGPGTLHDVRSVTKSVVALLYGIALAQGKVPGPDRPLFGQFPEHSDLVEADPRRARLTIGHALTMTLGTEWDETNIPYTDARNSEIAMEQAKDRMRFVLERRVIEEPGQRWIYSGGATALLGRIIAKGTGVPLAAFARSALFDPLGLGTTEWIAGHDQEASAASGLRMTPRDLATIGQLLLDKGQVDGRVVLSAEWIAQATTPRVSVDETRRFGYHWYVGDMSAGAPPRLERWLAAFGNGGQLLFVLPGLDLVVVVTAGNYNAPDRRVPPIRVLRELVLAGLAA